MCSKVLPIIIGLFFLLLGIFSLYVNFSEVNFLILFLLKLVDLLSSLRNLRLLQDHEDHVDGFVLRKKISSRNFMILVLMLSPGFTLILS